MQPYSSEVEDSMREFHSQLNEKDQRLYAGIEALKLGYGGRTYIAGLLGCSRTTVSKGAAEVSGLPGKVIHDRLKDEQPDKAKKPGIRRPGGGRKSYEAKWGASLDANFLKVVEAHTAGDPMDETIRWTYLTPRKIAQILAEDYQQPVSKTVVNQLLKKHHYRRRKAQKKSP